jgi:hypothetical protein
MLIVRRGQRTFLHVCSVDGRNKDRDLLVRQPRRAQKCQQLDKLFGRHADFFLAFPPRSIEQ